MIKFKEGNDLEEGKTYLVVVSNIYHSGGVYMGYLVDGEYTFRTWCDMKDIEPYSIVAYCEVGVN